MQSKFLKIQWTQHSQLKMRQYGLSKTKLLNMLYKPERKEVGVAPGTLAVMKTNKKFTNKTKPLLKSKWGNPHKAPGEIWLMYKDTNPSTGSGQAIRKVISAWRYPGITKPGGPVPVPQHILNEIESDGEIKDIIES